MFDSDLALVATNSTNQEGLLLVLMWFLSIKDYNTSKHFLHIEKIHEMYNVFVSF